MVYFWKLSYAKSTLTAVRSRLFCTSYPLKSYVRSPIVKHNRQNDLKYMFLISKSFMKSLNQDAATKERNYAELWETISQESSMSPALLRIFLESKYEAGCDMDYPSTLECFKKANISIDASIISTYIGFACNEGDMDLAKHYLDELKLLGFVPNIITFSKVLQGYIRNKSSEEVSSTIKLMTSLNYWPSSIGYHNALLAYADNGDTQSFMKTFKDYEEFLQENLDDDGNGVKILPAKLFEYYNHLVKSSSGLEAKEFILNKISEISELKLVYGMKAEAVIFELLLNHTNEAKALLGVMKKLAVMPNYVLKSVIAEIHDVPTIETLLEACDLSSDDQFNLILHSKISNVPKIYEALNFKSLSDHQKIFRLMLGKIVKHKDVDALKDILASKKFISRNYFLISNTLLKLGYDPKEAVNLFGKTEKAKESIAYGIILNNLRDSAYEDLEILVSDFKKDGVLPYNQLYDKHSISSKIINSLFGPKNNLINLNAEKEIILKKLDLCFGCINDQFKYILASELVNNCIERHKSTENESGRLVEEADILIDSIVKNKIRFHNVEAIKTLCSFGIKPERLDAINYAGQYKKNKLAGNYLKDIIDKSDYKALHKFLRNKINSNQMYNKGFIFLHMEGNVDKKAVPFDITAYMLKEMKAGAIKNDNHALYKTFAYCSDIVYSKLLKQNISSLLEKFIDEKENDLVEMTVREVLERKSISSLLFTQQSLESIINYDAEKIWPILMTHLNSKNNSIRQFVLKAATVYSSFPKPPIESSDNRFGIVSWPSYLLRDFLNQNHMANVKMISGEMIRLAKSMDLLEAFYLRSWAADISIKMKAETNLKLNSAYSFCSPKPQDIPGKLIREAFIPDGKINPLLLDAFDKNTNHSSEKYACNEIGRIISAEWDLILSEDVSSVSKQSYKMTSIDKVHFISNILNSSESKIKLTPINLTTIVNSVLENASSVSKGIKVIESLCQAYYFNKYTSVSSVLLGALKFEDPSLQTWLNDFLHKNSVNNDLQSAILSLALNYTNEKTSELCWDFETAEEAVRSILSKNKFSVVFDVFNGKFEPNLAKDNLDLCCDIAVHSPKQFNRLLHEFKSDQEMHDYVFNKVFDSLRSLSTPFKHRQKFIAFYKKEANNVTLTSDNKAYILAMQSVMDTSPLSQKNVNFLNLYFSEASKSLDNHTLASELNSLLHDNNFRKADIITNLKNLPVDDFIKISTPLSFVITAKRGLNSLIGLLYEAAEMNLSNILSELSCKAAPISKSCYGEAFYVLSKRMNNTPLNEMESQLMRFHLLNSFIAAPKSKRIDLSESVLNLMRNSVPDMAKKISEESLSDEDLKAVGSNFASMNGPGKTSLLLAWLTNFGDVKKVKFLLEHMPAEIARSRNPYVYFSECLNAANNPDAVSTYNNCVKELTGESPQNISSCLVGPHVSNLLRHWPDESIPSLLHLSNHFAISTKNTTFLMRVYANLVGRGLISTNENILNSTSFMNETSTLDHFESLLSHIQHRTSSSNPLLVPFSYLAGSPKYPLSSNEWNNVVTYVHQRDKDQLTSLIDLCLRNAALNAKVNDSLTVLIEYLENLSVNEITKVYDLAIICQSSTLREIWMVTQFKKDKMPSKINYLLTDTLMKRGLLAENPV